MNRFARWLHCNAEAALNAVSKPARSLKSCHFISKRATRVQTEQSCFVCQCPLNVCVESRVSLLLGSERASVVRMVAIDCRLAFVCLFVWFIPLVFFFCLRSVCTCVMCMCRSIELIGCCSNGRSAGGLVTSGRCDLRPSVRPSVCRSQRTARRMAAVFAARGAQRGQCDTTMQSHHDDQ